MDNLSTYIIYYVRNPQGAGLTRISLIFLITAPIATLIRWINCQFVFSSCKYLYILKRFIAIFLGLVEISQVLSISYEALISNIILATPFADRKPEIDFASMWNCCQRKRRRNQTLRDSCRRIFLVYYVTNIGSIVVPSDTER